jgi:hypothetical protein
MQRAALKRYKKKRKIPKKKMEEKATLSNFV